MTEAYDWTRPYRTWEATLKRQDEQEDAAAATKIAKQQVTNCQKVVQAWIKFRLLHTSVYEIVCFQFLLLLRQPCD